MTVTKPSKPEDEYFTRVEAEKKQKLAGEYQEKINKEERQQLKELHWMHCPRCGLELQEIVYRGVRVDKCFHCYGVFLADDELEQIAGGESGFLKGFLSLFQYNK